MNNNDDAVIIYKEGIIDQGLATIDSNGKAKLPKRHAGKCIRWFLLEDVIEDNIRYSML